MLDHVDFAVKDLARSRSFYVAALAPLGIVPVIEFDRADGHKGTGFGRNGIGVLFIGGGAAVGGRLHVAFRASSNEAVDAFHAAAVKAGGVDHGAPGFRPRYGEAYYAAFVRDPDGRIIEAVCRGESETTSRTK